MPVTASPRTRVPLSVLDLAPVGVGRTSADALADTTALARAADEWGFARFWVAEHHNMPGVASTSPAVLIAHLAAVTGRIHVGSGGVMLPNHPPLVVGEQFAMLEALHPGRIDLGIGRAPGTDPATAAALRRGTDTLSAEDFPQHLVDLLGLLGDIRDGARLAPRFRATPAPASSPQVWLLGSSGYSAQVAGLLGLPYVYAHHFGTGHTEEALALYRQSFRPSRALERPRSMVSVSVLVAGDAEEADDLAGPARVTMAALRAGRPGPVVTPDQARALLADVPPAQRAALPGVQVLGTADQAVSALEALVRRTGVDELMVTATTYDVGPRIDTLVALAKHWGQSGD